MKKTLSSVMLILFSAAVFAQGATPEEYIRRWAPTAVREMYRSGIPASITLAQGLLESRFGLSPLAADGNNHFGIKCHKDWTGKTMYFDDDSKGECFRVYDSPEESFADHSDFLRYRDRYKFLFEFETTDYKAWAFGLKKAGYATDPAYPSKLIRNIEQYKLHEYDKMTLDEAGALSAEPYARETEVVSSGNGGRKPAETGKLSKSEKREAKRAARAARNARKKKADLEERTSARIPESPLSLEEPKRIDKSQFEEFRFSLSRETYSRNGVPFVASVEGETYESIASSNHLFLKEILKFNDLKAPEKLLPGTIVYLQAKKNQSEKGLDKYIVDSDSESLRDICQRFGVKKSSVEKMNGFQPGYQPREGDTIVLRGKKVKRR